MDPIMGKVFDFQVWFDKQSPLKLETVESMIERHLNNNELNFASQLIDWMHDFWERFYGGSDRVHIAGPYCRISGNGYACRVMVDGVDDMKPDPQPTLEDGSSPLLPPTCEQP